MTQIRSSIRSDQRIEFGDWQTPQSLADEVLDILRAALPSVGSVLEPTCGKGTFLRAAANKLPGVPLIGYDISEEHIAVARGSLPPITRLLVADFFGVGWDAVLRELPEPLLLVGNPPWVTNAVLGGIEAANLPRKANFKNLPGLDAITGKSNFDISEWMILRLLEAASGREFVLAMLCKASVARRVMEHTVARGWHLPGQVRTIDARVHFGAAVDAVLLIIVSLGKSCSGYEDVRWQVFDSLNARAPSRHMGVVDGRAVGDLEGYLATRELGGKCEIEWRSGIKHDCARVMELDSSGGRFVNGFGDDVEIEPEYVYPLLKGSDLANGRTDPRRAVVVTQRQLGADTAIIRVQAPRTWDYLMRYQSQLDSRKSSIYKNQPRFAMFGIGDYSFAPYKVAICGLYKRLGFTVVEPIRNRPVMLDDTCYFLPCESLEQAREIAGVLSGEMAKSFFEARVFWDAKRPISKALLQSISIAALLRQEGSEAEILPPVVEQQELIF